MKAYTNYYSKKVEEDFLATKYFIILLVKKEEVGFLGIKLIIFLFLFDSSKPDLMVNFLKYYFGLIIIY